MLTYEQMIEWLADTDFCPHRINPTLPNVGSHGCRLHEEEEDSEEAHAACVGCWKDVYPKEAPDG